MIILSFDVGIINLAYCIFDTASCKILHWEVITLDNHASSYNKLYINLINELDKRKHMLNVQLVLIEKQPSFNPKMRIVAGCLQTYFFIRGVVDSPENGIKNVEFFSPKHKLKCYTGPPIVLDSKNKSKYSQTKKMGVIIAQSKLEEFNETLNIKLLFNESKKKDDLSDCYLQAITYAVFKKIIRTSTGVCYIEQVEKTLNKVQIKKQLKDYLDSKTPERSIVELFNTMDTLLKKSITERYSVEFPISTTSDIEKALGDLSMKKYFKLFVDTTISP